jgi:CheY-like chemotaxis protein
VTGDATQLHQVLLNLLVNARDALPDGGKIEVRAHDVVLDDHWPTPATSWSGVATSCSRWPTMTRRILEAAGYQVATATGGAAALATFVERRSEIAAVVTDLEMPMVDGAALMEALRDVDAEVPIIATSGGLGPPSDRFDLDANLRFLAKPSTVDQLLDLLSSMLAAGDGGG